MEQNENSTPAPPPDRDFRVKEHLMDLKGKAYLTVAARVYDFRQDYPISSGWSIQTIAEEGSKEAGYVTMRAHILNPEGKSVATAIKHQAKGSFADWIEKAETGAVGRALGLCGYGTIKALEEDEESLCDTPQERRTPPATPHPKPPAGKPAAAPPPDGGPAVNCVTCGKPVTPARQKFCQAKSQPFTHPEPACQVKEQVQ